MPVVVDAEPDVEGPDRDRLDRPGGDAFDTAGPERPAVYSPGHVGAALFCYAPVAAALTRDGEPALALVGAVVAVAVSTLPDADEFAVVPVDHRGPTHTVWFIGVSSLASAGLAALAGLLVGEPAALGLTVGVATAVSLTSHLLADSITPMGIRPFYPLSAWHHSFDLTPAKDPRANAAMLGLGVLFALSCQVVVLV